LSPALDQTKGPPSGTSSRASGPGHSLSYISANAAELGLVPETVVAGYPENAYGVLQGPV
jgi:hypothetical protein